MSFAANHSRFAFQIPALNETLRLVSFRYHGALSSAYECTVDIACERRDLPLQELLGKAGVLTLFDEQHPRHIHGEMVSLAQGGVGQRFTRYQVTLRPKLWLLGLRSGLRIFQGQSAREIVSRVLQDAGLQGNDVRWQLGAAAAVREYCVQYRESDLDFVNRLLAEEGWFYFFEQRLDGHTLVIADGNDAMGLMAGAPGLRYRPRSGRVSGEESVYEFYAGRQLQSGAVALRDYHFEKPAMELAVNDSADQHAALQHYHYPGHFQDNARGRGYVQAQLLGQQSRVATVQAHSDCMRLTEACRFSLQEHGNQAFNQEYLVTGVQVEGRQPQVLEEGAAEEGSHFAVQLQAIPANVKYKPPAQLPRPRIPGVQTAFVTGPKGEEIYTDRFGRVKVQFHWDREGRRDENSSCWLRVSQAWAGNQWGAMALPRIGQEVIVSFLNGDPDRPLVTGALYNGAHPSPYALPANKTRTTFKSQSTPGAGGYNELRMEDKKGNEQLFIHGQKDVDLYIKNDRLESIDHDRHRMVAAAALERIGQDYNTDVGANLNLKVGATLSQTVAGNINQKAAQNWLQKTGVDHSVKAGRSVILDAGMSITLKAGGGTIALDPGGVSITGSQVRINSGGGAGAAKGASPMGPQSPKSVDPGAPGSAVNPLGADARFKQQPVAFDQNKAKEIDESALKALEKTYKHGGTAENSNSAKASAALASTGAATLAASLARVHSGGGATATKVYSPERIEALLSGRGLGGQMSRHTGARIEAAALKEKGVTVRDTVVDLSGLDREQKLDAVLNETGYYLSDDTADAVVAAVDSGDDLLVITDAVNEGATNAKRFIASQPEVKAYRNYLEAAIQDPEGSAYGGGPGYIGGLAEGERLVSNILTVNSDKMPAGLKRASARDLALDAAGLALSGAPAVGMMRGAGKVVPNNNSLRFNSQADPLLDSMGPAQLSHPAEYKAILNDLEVNNVSIKYGDDSIAFSPNTAGGSLGNEILLPNEFSISALRHEYGHFLDHQALGSPRYIEYFKKPELILSTERRQYLGEIRTAREIGDTSARRTLIENYLDEKNYIIDRYYQRPYGGKVDTTTVGGN